MTDNTAQATTENGRKVPAVHSTSVQATGEAEMMRCLFLAAIQAPRDMGAVKAGVLEACQDPDLAQEALYSYRRAGQLIEGASIDLVDEIANQMGRIKSGWEIVEQYEDASKVRAYAIDIQTLRPDERVFWVKHIGLGGRALIEDRDRYEHIANFAQRRKRACIEALIPRHLLNAAIRQVKETLAHAHKEPLEARAKNLVGRFQSAFGVTEHQIEQAIGSKIGGMTEAQYVRLIAIAKSIKDGAPKDQFFNAPMAREPESMTVKAEPAVKQEPDKKKPARSKKQDAGAATTQESETPSGASGIAGSAASAGATSPIGPTDQDAEEPLLLQEPDTDWSFS